MLGPTQEVIATFVASWRVLFELLHREPQALTSRTCTTAKAKLLSRNIENLRQLPEIEQALCLTVRSSEFAKLDAVFLEALVTAPFPEVLTVHSFHREFSWRETQVFLHH